MNIKKTLGWPNGFHKLKVLYASSLATLVFLDFGARVFGRQVIVPFKKQFHPSAFRLHFAQAASGKPSFTLFTSNKLGILVSLATTNATCSVLGSRVVFNFVFRVVFSFGWEAN